MGRKSRQLKIPEEHVQAWNALYGEGEAFGDAAPRLEEYLRELWPLHRERAGIKAGLILWVFARDGWTDRGAEGVGKPVPINGSSLRLLAQCGATRAPLWRITISWKWWYKATEEQRRALLDHELCHCARDKNWNPIVRPHEVEEFVEVIERHGMWSGQVRSLVETANKQLALDLAEDQRPETRDQRPDTRPPTPDTRRRGKRGNGKARLDDTPVEISYKGEMRKTTVGGLKRAARSVKHVGAAARA